jgi:hypothetical protein
MGLVETPPSSNFLISIENMKAALKSKEASRAARLNNAKQGEVFNCRVIEFIIHPIVSGHQAFMSELESFIAESFERGIQHGQVLVACPTYDSSSEESIGIHWLAMDFDYRDGQANFFLIDASGDQRGKLVAQKMADYSETFAKMANKDNDKSQVFLTFGGIQNSTGTCAGFAWDHVRQLSLMGSGFYRQLSGSQSELSLIKGVVNISRYDLPGALLRNAQSWSFISSFMLLSEHSSEKVSRKGEDLESYASEHSREKTAEEIEKRSSPSRLQNHSVFRSFANLFKHAQPTPEARSDQGVVALEV